MKKLVRKFVKKPLKLFTKNRKRLMAAILFSIFTAGLIFMKSYSGEGENYKTLPERFLSMGTQNLAPSWGTPSIDEKGNVVESEEGSAVKVRAGKDENGDEIDWWIAKKSENTLTLYAAKPVEFGQYNTYYKNLEKKGNYDTTKANNWVTSAARAFFGRNQGAHPGDMESRTGNIDASEGDMSCFEKKYFTENMSLKVNPKSITTYDSEGTSFTSIDRFWLPCAIGGSGDNFGTTLTVSTNSKLEDEALDGDINLIPSKHLRESNIWTRTSFGENEVYLKDGKFMQALVTESKGYSPVMELDIKDVKFVSSVQGNKSDADGIFRPVSGSKDGIYYLKYGYTNDASVGIAENIESSSELKIPYYLRGNDAYLMGFVTNKDTGNVYFTSQIISASENGEATLDLSSVPSGNYELKSWIEIPEEGDRGFYNVSTVKTSSLRRGYKVTFEESENTKFFTDSQKDVTGKSIIVDANEPFNYVVNVDKNYNMSQLKTTLIEDGGDSGITLNPTNVRIRNTYLNADENEVKHLAVGGAIVTQGADAVVYETTTSKNYWSYSVPSVESDVTVRAVGANQINQYKIFQSTETQKCLESLSINGTDLSMGAVSDKYDVGTTMSLEWTYKDGYDVDHATVKLVPKDWVEEIDDNGTKTQIIKESYKEQYLDEPLINYSISGGSNVCTADSFSLPDYGSDLYLFIDGAITKKYRVTFTGSEECPDVFSTGKIFVANSEGEDKQPLSRAGIIKSYGESIKVIYYPDGMYDAVNSYLTISRNGETVAHSPKYYDDKDSDVNYYSLDVPLNDSSVENLEEYILKFDNVVRRESVGVNFDVSPSGAAIIAPDPDFGTSDGISYSVYYSSPYKFTVKPAEGFAWGKNGMTLTVDENKYKYVENKVDKDEYDVTVTGKNGRGITDTLNIKIDGLEELEGQGQATEDEFQVKIENALKNQPDLYYADSVGLTQIPPVFFQGTETGTDDQNTTKYFTGGCDALTIGKAEVTGNETDGYTFTMQDVNATVPVPDISGVKIESENSEFQSKFDGKSAKINTTSGLLNFHSEEVAVGIYRDENGEYKSEFVLSGNCTSGDGCSIELDGVTYSGKLTAQAELAPFEVSFDPASGKYSLSKGTAEEPLKSYMEELTFLPEQHSDSITCDCDIVAENYGVDSSFSAGQEGKVKFQKDALAETYSGDIQVDITKKSSAPSDLSLDLHKKMYSNEDALDIKLDLKDRIANKSDLIEEIANNTPVFLSQSYNNVGANDPLEFSATSSGYEMDVDIDISQINDILGSDSTDEMGKTIAKTFVKVMFNNVVDNKITIKANLSVSVKGTVTLSQAGTDSDDYVWAELEIKETNFNISAVDISNIDITLERAIVRGDKITNDTTKENIVFAEKATEDSEGESYIVWIDPGDDSGNFRICKTYGDFKLETAADVLNNDCSSLSQTERDNMQINNIFRISDVKSNSGIIILPDGKEVITVTSLDSDIDLKEAVNSIEVQSEDSTTTIGPGDIALVSTGRECTLTVSIKSYYDISGAQISIKDLNNESSAYQTVPEGTIDSENNNKKSWTIENVNQSKQVGITGIKRKKYTVGYPHDEIAGAKIYDISNGKDQAVTIAPGYSEDIDGGRVKKIAVRLADDAADYYFPDTRYNSQRQQDGNYDFMKLSSTDNGKATINNIADFKNGKLIGYTVIISDISDNITLQVDENLVPRSDLKCDVIFTYPEDIIDFKCDLSSEEEKHEVTVPKGGSVSFEISGKSGAQYENISADIAQNIFVGRYKDGNLEELTLEKKQGEDFGGTCTLRDIEFDEGIIVIVGDAERKQHYVRFEAEDSTIKLEDAVKIGVEGRDDNFVSCGVSVYDGKRAEFYITILDKFSKDSKITAKILGDDSGLSETKDEGNNKYSYETYKGIYDDITVQIGGLERNKSSVIFSPISDDDSKVEIYSLDDDSKIEDKVVSYEGYSYEFYIQDSDKYNITSVYNIGDISVGANEITKLEGEEAHGKKNAYKISNLYGNANIKIERETKMYEINFEEGSKLSSLSAQDQETDKFRITGVKGSNKSGKQPTIESGNKKIRVPHGEDVEVTFSFDQRFDKFDAGKTNNPDAQDAVGSITIDDNGLGKISGSRVKNSTTYDLTVPFIFTGSNTVKLNDFEVNKYTITFDRSKEKSTDYEIYIYDETKQDNNYVGDRVDFDVNKIGKHKNAVEHGGTYKVWIRPIGNTQFDPDASSVYITAAEITRTMNRQGQCQGGEYILYEVGNVVRDSTVTVDAKKSLFNIRLEGVNVDFYQLDELGNIVPASDDNILSDIEYGSDRTFYVKAHGGYNLDNATAKILDEDAAGTTIEDQGMVNYVDNRDTPNYSGYYRKYTIRNVTGAYKVLVENAKINQYPVYFKAAENLDLSGSRLDEVISIYDDNGNLLKWNEAENAIQGTAYHFSDFRFKYDLSDTYSKSDVKFTASIPTGGISEDLANIEKDTTGQYWAIKEALVDEGQNITVTIDNIKRNKYSVKFDGKGINFADTNGGAISNWNEFNQNQVMVETNQQTIEHSSGVLVFRVMENIEDGYTVEDTLDVRASSGKVVAYAGGGIKTTADGVKYREYELSDVLTDTVVTVKGAKSTFYTIDFKTDLNEDTDSTQMPPEGLKILDTDGRDISNGIRATNGSKVTFSIVMNDEYSHILNPNVYIYYGKDNQVQLQQKNGYYTASDIKSNLTVMITGLKGNTNSYTVNFAEKGDYDKVEFISSSALPITDKSVLHGGSYTFMIKPKDGYELGEATVKATNCEVVQSMAEAPYTSNLKVTLSNVTGNPEVVVNNVTLTLYDVKFELSPIEGEKLDDGAAKIYAYGSDRDITQGTQVYYQKDLEFRVVLMEGYTQSQITVKYKQSKDADFTVISPENGYYRVGNITGNTQVKVENLKKNTYSVKLIMDSIDASNVTLSQGTNTIKPNSILSNVVKHGESYQFQIEAKPGYNISNLSVTTKDADVTITPSSNTTATVVLSNVKGNLSAVTIGGINKDTFLVSFPGIENISVYDQNIKDITSTGKQVAYKGSLRFTLEPHEGYDRNKDNWSVTYETTDESGNIVKGELRMLTDLDTKGQYWEVKNVLSDVKIYVSGVSINNYKLSFIGSHVTFRNSVTDKVLGEGDKWASHGGYYTFKVKADEGYDLSNMSIETDVGDLAEESRTATEATYTLSNITKEATINVRIDKSKVEITFVPGTGIKYQDKDGIGELTGKQTVIYGNKFEFTVRALEGYDINTLKVKQGKQELPYTENGSDYRKFATTELKSDYDISTSIEKKKYSITVPEIEGVSFYENDHNIKGGESVISQYGDSFKFKISLDEKHNQSKIVVKANIKTQEGGQDKVVSKVLSEIDGFYTITDIAGNIQISVENVDVNKYTVNLVDSTGIQYNSGDGAQTDIKGTHVVTYGETFSFRISALEGYELSSMVVTVQGDDGSCSSLTPSGGVYAITNIKGNKTVKVSDSAMIQYRVTFAPADGVTYVNDTGNNIKDPIMVTHGNNFEFSIKIADAYDDSNPSVETTSSKSQISKLATGRYIISNVTEDMTIKTINVTKNKYTVTLKDITGVIYKGMDGRVLTGDQYVEHEGSFQFKVDLYPAYSDSSITAMVGNDEIKPESDGSFLITGIMENKTVTVTGVEENPEVRVINMINALRDSIIDASDVDAVVAATKAYNQLSDSAKSRVTNIDKLLGLQKESGTFIHTTNDITVDGVDWNIKLVAVPLSASSDEMGRVYNKLSTEFILSLYDIYLWDMMAEKKYTLPEGHKVKVTIPTPDLTYFKDTFIVHERSSDGKLEYLTLNTQGDKIWFETTSFCPMGVLAKRKVDEDEVHSSFFDTAGANINELKQIISSKFLPNKDSSDSDESSSESKKKPSSEAIFGDENVDEKFKQGNDGLAKWSALRLLLILIIGFAIAFIVSLIAKRRKRGPKERDKFEIIEHRNLDSEDDKKDADK